MYYKNKKDKEISTKVITNDDNMFKVWLFIAYRSWSYKAYIQVYNHLWIENYYNLRAIIVVYGLLWLVKCCAIWSFELKYFIIFS